MPAATAEWRVRSTVAHRLGGMRLAWAAAWMALGIGLSQVQSLPAAPGAWAMVTVMMSCLALSVRRSVWRIAAAIAVVGFGAAWASVQLAEPSEPWGTLAQRDRPLIEVEGIVASPLRLAATQRGALAAYAPQQRIITRTELAVERVRTAAGWNEAAGRLWLRIDDAEVGLEVGQRLRVMGHYQPITEPMNPGETDARKHAAQRNIVGAVRVADASLIESLGDAAGRWRLVRWQAGLKQRGLRALGVAGDASLGPGRALLAAITLGHRPGDDDGAFESFAAAGIAHLLAVSGLHLGLLVGMAMLVVRLTGDRPRLEVWAVLGLVLLYVVLVPARPPILRAAVMVVVLMLGLVGRRRYPPLNTLGLAAIIAMLIWPADVLSAGFQLSFLVVASLIVGVPAAHEAAQRWRDPVGLQPAMPWLMRWLTGCLCAGMIAWLVSLPILWAHFGLVSWLGIPATIIATPMAAVLLGWGFLAVLVGMVWPAAGAWLGDGAARLAAWCESMTIAAADWPGAATHAPLLPAWIAAISVALLFIAMVLMPRGVAVFVPRRAWAGSVIALALAWLLLIFGAWESRTQGRSVLLQMDTLAVGDGSCHLIRTRDSAIVYDAGSLWFSVGQQTIPMAGKATGELPIRTAIVSHPDVDHFSGLLDAAGPLGVERVLVPRAVVDDASAKPSGAAAALLRGLEARGVSVRVVAAGDAIELGAGVRCAFLHPPDGFAAPNDNAHSLVMLIEVQTDEGVRRVLMTGDLAGQGVALVRDGWRAAGQPVLHAMEVPHHGAAAADAIALVSELDPRIVVQSSGRSRIDDPRWAGVREGRHWFATARDGSVVLTIHRDGSVRARAGRSRR